MAEIWTIGKILKWTEEYFQKYNIENPRLDAEILLGYVLNKERIFLYVHFDQPLDVEELAKFKECIKKRAMKMPVAYITGVREFMGLDFKVTEATLIPRPDTEILVETAMERLGKIAGNETGTGKCFADLGTGSGAISLSIINYMKEIEDVTVDISPKAIAVAKENAEKFAVSDRIEFLEGDFLKPLENKGKFTAILSNPPYIPKQDILGLESDVKDFEPMGALDGGIDGLDFYRQLLVKSANYIEDGGFLAIEIGINQSQAILEMAKRNLMWGKVEVIKDLAGIDRCVVLWKK